MAALAILMPACGGSGSSSNSAPGILSGNWQMSLQKNNAPNLAPKTQSGFLLQQKDVVTGNVVLKATPCSGVGSVAGLVNGSSVALTVSPSGVTVNLSGTLGSDQASMSGDYTIISQGCGGSQTAPETGMWTATLVQPLSGNFTGTFTSSKLGDLPVTGMVSQSKNTGTTAPVTGNLSITGYCFSTANLSGTISGTNVVMNMLGSDGTQIGEVTGTTTADGKSITGKYFIVPRVLPPPCVAADSGTVTLSL